MHGAYLRNFAVMQYLTWLFAVAAASAGAMLSAHVNSCFGNLEQVHNDIHNILGGTAGEMA